MQEYISDAVVLDAEPNGDLDSRVSLFTERFGKLVVKAKSARKITSKLAGHLQIGNLVKVRLIEKNGLQAADALKQAALQVSPQNLHILGLITAEAEPDQKLWLMLTKQKFSWPEILKLLGWDPAHARCANCGAGSPEAFFVHSQEFLCKDCVSKMPGNGIYLEI